MDELRLNMHNQYILVLNETRLDESICDSEMSTDKYIYLSQELTVDHDMDPVHVTMYIRNSISFKVVYHKRKLFF